MKSNKWRVLAVLLLVVLTGFVPLDLVPETILGTGKQPDICVDKNGTIKLTYGAGNQIFYASSTDGGQTFSKPTAVGTLTKLSLGMGCGPQVAATKDFTFITAVNNKGNIYTYSLASKKDAVWEKPVPVNDADTVAKEGFVAVAAGAQNNAFAVWLDMRADNQNKIYGARSADGGRTWKKNQLIYRSPDQTVCQCCKPNIIADAKGNVHVQFRNWLLGNRDLHLISSADQGLTFGPAQKLGRGSWPLKGCPMDGGDLAADATGKVITVWRRESSIYLASPGEPEIKLGPGKIPTMVATPQGPAVVWQQEGNIVLLAPNTAKTTNLGKGTFPKLALLPNGRQAVCAYERDGQIVTKVVALK